MTKNQTIEDVIANAETAAEAAGLAVGFGSMCWDKTPEGAFRPEQAARAVYALTAWIEERIEGA